MGAAETSFALETVYVALKQAQIITFLGQGRPMPRQERFGFIFRFFLRQAYYGALAGPDLCVDKASVAFREILLFLPPEFCNKRHLVAWTSFLRDACQHICHLGTFTVFQDVTCLCIFQYALGVEDL